MAASSSTNPTLVDFANRMDPNGKITDVVEILNETNRDEVMADFIAWANGVVG